MNSFKDLDDLKTLTLCAYGEARGEGVEGMLAVCSVVINRTRVTRYTIKSVCLKPYQFSCFNANDSNSAKLLEIAQNFDECLNKDNHLKQAYWIAKGIMDGWLQSNVYNATHYHAISILPKWALNMEKIKKIGNHQFYFERR